MVNKIEYIKKFMGLCDPTDTLISEYVNAKTPVSIQCEKGHIRKVTTNDIVSRNRGVTCPECKGFTSSGKKTLEKVAEEFLTHGYEVVGEYLGALLPIKVRHIECGSVQEVRASRATKSSEILCKVCTGKRSGYTTEDLSNELKKNSIELLDTYKGMKTKVSVKYINCGHIYNINLGHYFYDGIGKTCLTCSGLGSIKNKFFSNLIGNGFTLLEEYVTANTAINVRNNACGHEYKIIPNNWNTTGSGEVCRVCNPGIWTSAAETDIIDFIKSLYDGWVIQSDRNILGGKELDIVLPDLGIAIEYNGVKWHSEEKKGIEYHLNKTNQVEEFGYQLIHIMETEWLKAPQIVKSRIRSILGKSNKIYARNTVVRRVDFPGRFLDNNHIQGAGAPTKYNYGLFYKEELVAVMTFAIPRFSKDADYELVRYCSIINNTVVGGASKLLKAFRSEYSGSILSYSDKRWSQGNLYKKLGFIKTHSSKPSYRYYKYKYSYSRFQCQKHMLDTLVPEYYQEGLSEHEIMTNAGFSKVYDCGSDVWKLA